MKVYKSITLGFIVLIVISSLFFNPASNKIKANYELQDFCHFGVNNVYKFMDNYDMTLLGVDSYINWSIKPDLIEPINYQHVKVIRTWGDDTQFEITKTNLPSQIHLYRGAIWIIGNEPDTTYEDQDNLPAEIYAKRFLELSSIIRNSDSEALIGFAPIVQPSPVRIFYLELVLEEMEKLLEGTELSISSTFDIWTIHAFLLNEIPGSWGTGLPQGITLDMLDENHQPLSLDLYTDTHSISLFKNLIINFREWIKEINLGNKPLWITEFGSLMPYYYVPESETITYLNETFDFLISYKDTEFGYPADDYRLVQKWYWFSLNHSIEDKGGSFYNLDNNFETATGRSFRQYKPKPEHIITKNPDFEPISLEGVYPIRYSGIGDNVDYLVKIRVRNYVSADHNSAYKLTLYDEKHKLISTGFGTTVRCAGDGLTYLYFPNLKPGTKKSNLKIVVDSISLLDINSDNNEMIIHGPIEFNGVPELLYLPLIKKNSP